MQANHPQPDSEQSDAQLRQDAAALQQALATLLRVYQFRDRDRICCYDISVTQCYALEALAERGPMRLQALADQLLLDKSTITRVVDALQRKGHVERRVEAEDGRALSLRITRKGRALQQKIQHGLIEQQVEPLADLAPRARADAIAVIRRLGQAAERRFLAGVSVGESVRCAAAPCE